MLQDTVERVFTHNLYADIARGIFLVRGENVLLLGEIVNFPLSYCGRVKRGAMAEADLVHGSGPRQG